MITQKYLFINNLQAMKPTIYALGTMANLMLTIGYAQLGLIIPTIVFSSFTAICFILFNQEINK